MSLRLGDVDTEYLSYTLPTVIMDLCGEALNMHSTSVLPQLEGLEDTGSDLGFDPRQHRLIVSVYAGVTVQEFLVEIDDGGVLALDEAVGLGLRWELASTYLSRRMARKQERTHDRGDRQSGTCDNGSGESVKDSRELHGG